MAVCSENSDNSQYRFSQQAQKDSGEGVMNPETKTEFSCYTPDELSELYKKNPNHFDELAAEAIIHACIGRTPERTIKLRQMQWTIDGQLRKGSTPLQRMQIMENIFYSHVFGDDGELAHLKNSCTELLRAVNGTYRVSIKKPALYLMKR